MESPKVLPSGHARQRAERGRAGAWWRWLRVRVGFAVQNLGRVARGFDSLQVWSTQGENVLRLTFWKTVGLRLQRLSP